jgi:hypothetical protein
MARVLDTLELFDEFKGQFTEAQAHTLSKALKQVEQARLEELATKADLQLLKTELDAKIERLELRLTVKMGTLTALAVGIVTALLKLR